MKYHKGMTQKEMWARSYELIDIMEPYTILTFDMNSEFNYRLSDDAPPEVIEADKEYRSFAKDLEPIR